MLRNRCCRNTILTSLQRPVCFSYRQILFILSGCCDHSWCGTWRWIIIVMMRLLMIPNTRTPFWSKWKMNTVQKIDKCLSLNPKMSRMAITAPLPRLLDLVNHLLIHLICPAMMRNSWHLNRWLKWHPDEAIMQHPYWQLQGSIWIHCLKHQRLGGKYIQILMITTPIPWRLAIHFGNHIVPTGGTSKRNRTQSMRISPMWHAT